MAFELSLPTPAFRHHQFNHIRSPLAPQPTSSGSTSPSSHHYFSSQPVPMDISPIGFSSNKRTRSRTFSRDPEQDSIDTRRLRINTSSISNGLPTPPLSACSSSSSGGSSLASLSSFPLSFSSLQGWQPSQAGIISESILYEDPGRSGQINGYNSAEECARLQEYASKGFGTPALRPNDASLSRVPTGRSSSFSGPAPAHFEEIPVFHHFKRSKSNGPPQELALPSSLPAAPTLDNQHLEIPETQKPWDQEQMVDDLVGTAMHAIDSIWNVSSQTDAKASGKVLPLKYFITETLRRSRSGSSTLQVALYYLHRARVQIRERVVFAEQTKQRFSRLAAERQAQQSHLGTPPASPSQEFTDAAAELLAASRDPVICGRRMFLAALISASKFLQDRNYSNRAWSRLSGLPVKEINANERSFLDLMDYKLHISADMFQSWTARLQKLAQEKIGRQSLAGSRANSEYLPAPAMHDGPCASLRSPVAPKAGLARSMTEADLYGSGRRISLSALPTPAASPNCAPLTMLRRQSEALRHSTSSLPSLSNYASPARRPELSSRRMSSSTNECRPHLLRATTSYSHLHPIC